MFEQLFFILIFVTFVELYFSFKAITFLAISLIYVIIVAIIALKHGLDLLFLTLIIVAVSSVLSLTIILFSLYNKSESSSNNLFYNFNLLLFIFFITLISTFFVTTPQIIDYKWVSYLALISSLTFQVTHLLHQFVMYFFISESSALNVIIFMGLLTSLNTITLINIFSKERGFKKIGSQLKIKRFSRRLNTFSSLNRF